MSNLVSRSKRATQVTYLQALEDGTVIQREGELHGYYRSEQRARNALLEEFGNNCILQAFQPVKILYTMSEEEFFNHATAGEPQPLTTR